MKIAVTGSTGHIGFNIVKELRDSGYAVQAIYRSPEKTGPLKDLGVECIQADALDSASLQKAFEGMDAVMHLAGVISIQGDPDGTVMKTNVEGSRNVVEACLSCGVRKLLHFSSIHAFRYRKNDPVVTERHPPSDARSFKYDHSKALGEAEIIKGVTRGLDAVILNPTAVIGPYDYQQSLSGKMLRNLFEGKLPALIDDGFDWVDVRDLVGAAIAALEKGRPGERYILSGRWASTRELAHICEKISGQPAPRFTLPAWVAVVSLPLLHLYCRLRNIPPLYTYESLMVLKHSNKNFSHEKATRELGYAPRPLEETIRDVFEWMGNSGSWQ